MSAAALPDKLSIWNFPRSLKTDNHFINSSPRLFPPLNDYACPRKPYYVDFAGVDDDGDSLVYSLVTPLEHALYCRLTATAASALSVGHLEKSLQS